MVLMIIILPAGAGSRDSGDEFELIKAAEGLEHPWAIAFLPDGSLLVTERPGRLLHIAGSQVREVSGLPKIHAEAQGGLLDIALHPEFHENQLVYMTFSQSDCTGSGTALMRGVFNGEALEDIEILYRMPKFSRHGVHYGSRIVFAPDGTIYLTIGDRGERHRARDLLDAAGKTIRLNDDGSVPHDNPFVGHGDALNEIFSYGHRNSQGMAVHPETGAVWQHEHGPRGGDELNILVPGADYGWPLVSHGEEYSGGSVGIGTSAPGVTDPITYWTPAVAPSGMTFYTGDAFSQWQGSLFIGSLVRTHLRRLELSGNEVTAQEILLSGEIGRIRDVREAPDGTLWLITDARNGALYQMVPAK